MFSIRWIWKRCCHVANYGFPMVLSWYLLVRMEGRLDRLTDSINSLARSIAAGKTA